jgi:hypothetical protein
MARHFRFVCSLRLGLSHQSIHNWQVVVNNAPNLGDPDERKKVHSMVHTFASTRHTIGDESVQLWLNEMEWYYSDPRHGIGLDLSNVTSNQVFYGLAQV